MIKLIAKTVFLGVSGCALFLLGYYGGLMDMSHETRPMLEKVSKNSYNIGHEEGWKACVKYYTSPPTIKQHNPNNI